MAEDTGATNPQQSTSDYQRTQIIDSPMDDPGMFETLSSVEAGKPVTNINDVELLGGDKNASEQEGGEDETLSEAEAESDSEAEAESEGEVDPEIKLVTAAMGDEKYDVPEDAVISFKVDGKEVKASIAELRRNYQGKIPWERHYGETKALEKQLKEREQAINQGVGAIEAKLKDVMDTFEKNPYLAFEKIAMMHGKNPADYLPLYIAQSRKTLEELQKLSEAEYNALILQKRTKHESNVLEEKKKNLDQQQTRQAVLMEQQQADAYFGQKAAELGFTEEEIQRSVKIIQESGENLGNMKPKEIADLLVGYISNIDRKYTKIDAAIRKVDESLLQDREFISNLGQLTNSSFTTEEIEEIIRTYISDSTPAKPKLKAKATSKAVAAKESSSGKQTPRKIPHKQDKSRVNGSSGNKDVGPLSIHDILSEYDL